MGRGRPQWQKDGRERGAIFESGDAEVDQRRVECLNKVLAFDDTINYDDFEFLFPGLRSRPKRLINHLISLDCLPHLDTIYRIIFRHGRREDRRSRSPQPSRVAQATRDDIRGQDDIVRPPLSSSEVEVSGVVLHDVHGNPITFRRDPGTTNNLLRVVQAQNARVGQLVKQELAVKDEVRPDDSISHSGLANVQAPFHGASGSSDASVATSRSGFASIVSCSGTKGQCFPAEVRLRLQGDQLVEAKSLKAGDTVLSFEDEPLSVTSVKIHVAEHPLVRLRTSSAVLTVTDSHRVMLPRGSTPQTIPAGHLRESDFVYCSEGKLEQLVEVKKYNQYGEAVEVTFRPDQPVEALCPAVLSKGHGWPQTTRRSRRKAHGVEEDLGSIPDTEDSFF